MPCEIITEDGSKTLFSSKYNQNFHDTKTGALKESLTKHVIPALTYHNQKKQLNILDICFGIGYNTFATLYYIHTHNLDIKLNIYSPELDEALVKSLESFDFPPEFDFMKPIIQAISKEQFYEDENLRIEVFIGDARQFIQTSHNLDIVFQDAFSSEVNRELWSVEYFQDLFKACNDDVIMTTYSVATPVRLSMYEAGFEIFEIKPVKKKQTLAFKHKPCIDAKYINMEHKKEVNKEAQAIYDK